MKRTFALAFSLILIAAVSGVAQPAWQKIAPRAAIPARYGHAMAYDAARGCSVLFGGQYSSTSWLNDTWSLDAAPSWAFRPGMYAPSARTSPAMAYDSHRQRVVLFGGLNTHRQPDTWEWDGYRWLKRTPKLSPPPRSHAAMAYDSRRKRIVLFGGAGNTGPLKDTWEWDGTTWTQRSTAGPSARWSHAMAYDSARGVVVLFAGTGGYVHPYYDLWEWNGSTWKGRAVTIGYARQEHSMVYDPHRRRTVIFGGRFQSTILNDTIEWDGSKWIAQNPATRPGLTTEHAMAYDLRRRRTILASGRYIGARQECWEWNGATWARTALQTAPRSRYHHAMTWVGAGPKLGACVFLYGGHRLNECLDDTWIYNANTWTRVIHDFSPGKRWMHCLAADTKRNWIFLFGGNKLLIHQPVNETWVWNGQTWGKSGASIAPPARNEAAMAYDPDRDRMILFGGYAGAARFADTWELDPPRLLWTNLTKTSRPPARFGTAMVYYPDRKQMVMFGGHDGKTMMNDTWIMDYYNSSRTWHRESPKTSPPGRFRHKMVYDASRKRVVMFGGASWRSAFFNDAWEWDGENWTKINPPSPPSPRFSFSMAYNRNTKRNVVFGGYFGYNLVSNETWEHFTTKPASTSSFGKGCKGSHGKVPVLYALTPPVIGRDFHLQIRSAPPSRSSLLALGVQRVNVDLGPIGAPGCTLYTQPIVFFNRSVDNSGRWWYPPPLEVPNVPGLAGFELQFQVAVPDAKANALGMITSNAIIARIGY